MRRSNEPCVGEDHAEGVPEDPETELNCGPGLLSQAGVCDKIIRSCACCWRDTAGMLFDTGVIIGYGENGDFAAIGSYDEFVAHTNPDLKAKPVGQMA